MTTTIVPPGKVFPELSPAGGDDTLEGQADSGVDAEGLLEHGLEVRELLDLVGGNWGGELDGGEFGADIGEGGWVLDEMEAGGEDPEGSVCAREDDAGETGDDVAVGEVGRIVVVGGEEMSSMSLGAWSWSAVSIWADSPASRSFFLVPMELRTKFSMYIRGVPLVRLNRCIHAIASTIGKCHSAKIPTREAYASPP